MVSINLRKGAWMFILYQITSVCLCFLFWKMVVMIVPYRFVGGWFSEIIQAKNLAQCLTQSKG